MICMGPVVSVLGSVLRVTRPGFQVLGAKAQKAMVSYSHWDATTFFMLKTFPFLGGGLNRS